MRDFPWLEWLAAARADLDEDATDRIESQVLKFRAAISDGAVLKLRSTAVTGGQGIKIVLEKRQTSTDGPVIVIAERTMAGAFGGKADSDDVDATPLSRIGVRCKSENPALGIGPGSESCSDCDAPLYVSLRGAGNLYFADVESAIHVPDNVPGKLTDEFLNLFENAEFIRSVLREAGRSPNGKLSVSDAMEQFSQFVPWLRASEEDVQTFVEAFNELEPYRQLSSDPVLSEKLIQLKNSNTTLDDSILKQILHAISLGGAAINRWDVVPEGLLDRINLWLTGAAQHVVKENLGLGGRGHEYTVFSMPEHRVEGRPKSILKLRSHPIASYGPEASRSFDHIALLDTLRETRVLKGYSRLFSRQQQTEDYANLMWRTPPTEPGKRWLPATMVFGEGIFFRFAEERLHAWESEFGRTHSVRLKQMNENAFAIAMRRRQEPSEISPRKVLVHTFAHILINQLIFDSGYGSSSLRERLYVTGPDAPDGGMAGLLIYTAAGDTEGSMGGLVRLGEPGILERTLSRALERSLWCSSDPVCIESAGQGPENCNLAACHSCALLPETSCEEQNRFLDRGVVTGTLESPESGFFYHLLKGADRSSVE